MSRPAFNPAGLLPSVAAVAMRKAALAWCFVTPEGCTFYVSKEKAYALLARHPHGKVYPPEVQS